MKSSPFRLSITLVFAISMGVISNAHATDRFVSPTGNDTTNDCSNSGTPCATFSNAITQSTAGDAIHAAAGTYTETGIGIDKDLTVDGAGQNTTIIDAGGNSGPVLSIQ